MKQLFGILIIATCLLQGCGKKTTRTQIANLIDSFPRTFICDQKQQIPIAALNPTAVIASDTLLVLLLRHEEKVLKVYRKADWSLKGEILTKGKGPNEVSLLNRLNQWDTNNGKFRILIQSYPYFLGWLDVNRSLDSGTTVFTSRYDFDKDPEGKRLLAESNVVFDWKAGKLIMNKDPERSNTFMENPNPFFITYDYPAKACSDTVFLKSLRLSPKLSNTLTYAGYSSISPSQNTWARAFSYLGTIDFYDLSTNAKKSFCLSPDVLDCEKSLQNAKKHFTESAATRDFYFALGGVAKPEEEYQSHIYMFDWQGNPKCELLFTEPLHFFSVNQDTGELYAIDRDERIFRYDISKMLNQSEN